MKYVSLHNHDGYSLYDGLGTPNDYAEWILKNAGDDCGAIAITNHGNINSAGYIAAAQKKYDGKVKFIWGNEFYYIPSLPHWWRAYEKQKEEKKNKDKQSLIIEDEKESKSVFYGDPLKRRHHLVVLAQNQKGLENLFALTSRSYKEGFYRKPRIDFELLRQFNEGLIVSTACLGSPARWAVCHPDAVTKEKKLQKLEEELGPFMDVFGKDRFFLEIQFNKIEEQQLLNECLLDFSKQSGYKLIATCDAHFQRPEMWRDAEIHRLLGYQAQKRAVDDLDAVMTKTVDDLECHLYLKNHDQMVESLRASEFGKRFGHDKMVLAAITRTHDVAHDLIEDVRPDTTPKLLKVFTPNDKVKTSFDELKRLCLEGLKKKGLTSKEYIDRTAYELKVIKKLEIEDYFLTKKAKLDVLRKYMLTGCARGSGAGSIVNYLLDITFIDPIKYNLLFERFISVSRKEIPDIDSDMEKKEIVLEILQEHFGEDNVVAVTIYNRLQLKSLVKDFSNLYGIPFQEVNAVTRVMESEAKDKIMEEVGNDQKLYEFTFDRAKKHSPTFIKFLVKYPDIEKSVANLYQEIKSLGTHAGGIISTQDLEKYTPIIKSKGKYQTPITEGITAQHLQQFGLIKFDFLGLATLKIISRCIENIIGVNFVSDVWEFYNENLHPDVINTDDKKVYRKVFHKGQFPLIFQFAESGMQSFAKRAKPTSIEDISAISAIFRPGALKDSGDKKYVWALQPDKKKAFKKEHPIIRKILGNTRGVIAYQEQWMLLAHELAGFTLEEANKLRKLLVKPMTSLADEIKKERIEVGNKFIQGCIDKGLSSKRAHHLWESEILGFISYGFNFSHSLSYAFNTYQCAWLYTYYEKEWIKACLEQSPNLEKTINVVRQLGYKIQKPDINLSSAEEWTVTENKKCFPCLTSLKGVGVVASKEIVHHRPEGGFKDIEDFFFGSHGNWRWSKVNKTVLQTLIKIEAFKSLGCVGATKLFKNYRHMLNSIFGSSNFDKLKKHKIQIEQAAKEADKKDWAVANKMEIQKEIVGFYDKNLIVGEFLTTFQEFGINGIDEVADEKSKGKVWAVIEKVESRATRKGDEYLVVSSSGMSEKQYVFKVWNTSLKDTKVWQEGSVVVFYLEYDKKYGYSVPRGTKTMKVTK